MGTPEILNRATIQISLENQVAVVTGGSRGIGAAAVKLFAEAGAKVVFNYRKASGAAQKVVRGCGARAPDVVAVQADVSKMADAKKLVDGAVNRFGRLDILVANAGFWNPDPAPIERLTERQWDEMMDINLKGVYSVIHYATRHMIPRKSGRIIVVSSTAGQRGEAFHTHYGASKGGVISLVKGLSTELAPHGILVNCVAPGWVDTDMAASVAQDRREYRKALATIPLRRFARPQEIALPIIFLASEMASYMTGEIVNVNGGNVLCG
ncbi:MAG: glucose 1-dehydrogenase [Acidobacteria bacterium]|nr:glucose 1-dehydrogenase [Acidobacteriota bacterium]